MRTTSRSALLLLAAACVQQPGLGPDLGECADVPDAPYTFGEAGIGTCLAGPVDAQFHVRDGLTYLTVTNADPFRTFSSGSLLEIPATALQGLRGTVGVHTLGASELPMETLVGRFAYARNGQMAVVSSRLTETSFYRGDDDRVWLVDLTDPTRPAYHDTRFVTVGADPTVVLDDPFRQRTFVIHATTTDVSVLNLASEPPSRLSPTPASLVTDPTLTRVPGSIGVSELLGEPLVDTQIARTDRWSVTRVDGAARLWTPTDCGLARYNGTSNRYEPIALGVEVFPLGVTRADCASADADRLSDPFIAGIDGTLVMYFEQNGSVLTATTDGHAGNWTTNTLPALNTTNAWSDVGGPTVASVAEGTSMYFHGRLSDAGPRVIAQAVTGDGLQFVARNQAIVEAPDGFEEVAQPAVYVDPTTRTVRMWMSMRDASGWMVGHAESTDSGTTWTVPEPVLTWADGDAAAPTVVWTGGRFLMWLSVSDGVSWSHAVSWSWDGLSWTPPRIVADSDRPITDDLPPRGAAQPSATEAWRFEGDNAGPIDELLAEGSVFASATRGFTVQVASGHVLGRNTASDLDGGLLPGSLVTTGSLDTLYATGFGDDGRPRILAYRRTGGAWVPSVTDVIPEGQGGNADGVRDPVVYQVGSTWHLIYSAGQGEVWTLRHATSPDGLTFTPDATRPLGAPLPWETQERRAHQVLPDPEGGFTMWYAGTSGGRFTIGQAHSDDGTTWTRVDGPLDGAWFEAGDPGTFHDSGVRDPFIAREGDTEVLWFSAFDGDVWRIGSAVRAEDGTFVPRVAPLDDAPSSTLQPVASTFSAVGVESPLVYASADGPRMLYAGFDGLAFRIGEAIVDVDRAWPAHRFPSGGDTFTFVTRKGVPGRSNIDLGQVVQGFPLPGAPGTGFRDGVTAGAIDPVNGWLFTAGKDFPGIIVVDIRDDSTADFDDLNYLDVETVLRFDTTTGILGVQSMALGPDGLLYLAVREPDGVLVVDPSIVVDNDVKEIVFDAVLGNLPMHDLTDDDGDETFAAVGAAELAFVPGQNLLLVTHMRDASVSVFDLSLGVVGEEIRHIEDVGENPYLIEVSPDGLYAVVGTYLGGSGGGIEGSTLVILDLDPTSPTWLEPVARIVNR